MTSNTVLPELHMNEVGVVVPGPDTSMVADEIGRGSKYAPTPLEIPNDPRAEKIYEAYRLRTQFVEFLKTLGINELDECVELLNGIFFNAVRVVMEAPDEN